MCADALFRRGCLARPGTVRTVVEVTLGRGTILLWTAVAVLGIVSGARANLLNNPGFETGSFSGWTVVSGGASVIPDDSRSGAWAARLVNGEVRQGWVNLHGGRPYKAFAWVRIASETGSDWGGFRIEVVDANWQSLAHSGALLTETHGTNWFKVALSFTATTPRVLFLAGYFGGGGRTQVVHLDDCALVEDAPGNLPPAVNITLDPVHVSAPAPQSYRLSGDDPDGTIRQIVWEFGDGTRAFGWHGSRRVGLPGDFTARVLVADDEGLVVTQQLAWSARRADLPGVLITNPVSLELTTNAPVVLVSGTATGLATVAVSTDRGFYGLATGSNAWSISVTLQPGWNRIHAHHAERRIRYVPPGPLAVLGLSESTNTVERWEPLEITFQITNSAATHPHLPFEAHPPPGLAWVDGITVDGLFTPDNWQTIYRRPAFLWQPYARARKGGAEWMYPTNEPRWCVRFAPRRRACGSIASKYARPAVQGSRARGASPSCRPPTR